MYVVVQVSAAVSALAGQIKGLGKKSKAKKVSQGRSTPTLPPALCTQRNPPTTMTHAACRDLAPAAAPPLPPGSPLSCRCLQTAQQSRQPS